MAKSFLTGQIPFVVNIQQKQKPRVETITENGKYNTEAYRGVNVQVEGMKPSGELSITENNTYDVTSYASAVVNVPNPSTGTKNITANGNNIDVTEFAKVNVNVPNPSTGTKYVTENNTYDVTNYAYVDVNVESSGGKTILPITVNDSSSYINFVPRESNTGLVLAYDDQEEGKYYYSYDSSSDKILIDQAYTSAPDSGFLYIQSPSDDYTCNTMSSSLFDTSEDISGEVIIVLAGVCSEGEFDIKHNSPFGISFVNAGWITEKSQCIDWLVNHFNLSGYNYVKIVDMNGKLLEETNFEDENFFSIYWSAES